VRAGPWAAQWAAAEQHLHPHLLQTADAYRARQSGSDADRGAHQDAPADVSLPRVPDPEIGRGREDADAERSACRARALRYEAAALWQPVAEELRKPVEAQFAEQSDGGAVARAVAAALSV
jgi:hypothetical protein